jgi:hypothetical protein
MKRDPCPRWPSSPAGRGVPGAVGPLGIVFLCWLVLLVHLAITARRRVAVERGIARLHQETDVQRPLSDWRAAPASRDVHGSAA